MNVASFVDTNVLLYAAGSHLAETEKHLRAIDVLEEPDLVISVQVLQEFYAQATRRSRNSRLTHEQALQFLTVLDDVTVITVTFDTFFAATLISNRYQLSYWDGAILAAAQAAGCDAVYSEDMSTTQDYGGINIINPFVDSSR